MHAGQQSAGTWGEGAAANKPRCTCMHAGQQSAGTWGEGTAANKPRCTCMHAGQQSAGTWGEGAAAAAGCRAHGEAVRIDDGEGG